MPASLKPIDLQLDHLARQRLKRVIGDVDLSAQLAARLLAKLPSEELIVLPCCSRTKNGALRPKSVKLRFY